MGAVIMRRRSVSGDRMGNFDLLDEFVPFDRTSGGDSALEFMESGAVPFGEIENVVLLP